MNPNREVLYVGKAVKLRNRLQQHKVIETISNDAELDQPWGRLQVAVWYLPTQIECKVAEASLIRRLRPRYNMVDEGEDTWEPRLPDADGVDFLTIRPETRRDVGEPCPIEDRPGVYAWYLISEQARFEVICEIMGWDPKELPPDAPPPPTSV